MSFEVPYAITKQLQGVTLPEARSKLEAALKAEGFGVLTEIDVQATLKNKLGVEIKPYVILGACNPGLAHQAISLDPTAGLLLPCNVVLTVEEDGVVVSAASPLAMFQTLGQTSPTARIAEQAEQQLRRAIAAL